MATLAYSVRALLDLDRFVTFLEETEPVDREAVLERVIEGLEILRRHPLVGRTIRRGLRELVISQGRDGYLALYRFLPRYDRVEVLAFRHQREGGYG